MELGAHYGNCYTLIVTVIIFNAEATEKSGCLDVISSSTRENEYTAVYRRRQQLVLYKYYISTILVLY